MASYRKRQSGRWRAQIRRKRYRPQTRTFRTKALAEAWVRSIEFEMDQGCFLPQNEVARTTLGELLEPYRREVTAHKKGRVDESYRIGRLMRHHLSERYIGSLRGVDITLYRDELLMHVTADTLRRELSILSQVFEVSRKEWGIFVHNPVRDIRLPSKNRPRDRRLNRSEVAAEDEQTRLFDACRRCRNPYLLPLVRLALDTAMRQGELLNLRWEHIDFKRRTAFLPDTKHGESRMVPLSGTAIAVLSALPRSITGGVFPSYSINAVEKAFVRARRHAGIHDLRFHDPRHEATTRFFELGLNIMEVAAITGHKDIRMLTRYTHFRAEDIAVQLAELDTSLPTDPSQLLNISGHFRDV